MTHLRENEFVELLEGTLHATRAAHVRDCADCRATADRMQDTLARVSSDPAEGPSPLFWQHFAARVNERIDQPQSLAGWFTGSRVAFGGLAALAIALLVFTLLATPRGGLAPVPDAPPVVATAPEPAAAIDDLDADRDWAVVRVAADDLNLDDAQAAGLAARPGTADRVAMELSAAERAELIRLLQVEFKTGA